MKIIFVSRHICTFVRYAEVGIMSRVFKDISGKRNGLGCLEYCNSLPDGNASEFGARWLELKLHGIDE